MAPDQLQDLVKAKVANLRPKLLDLSRRNPLLSTSFSLKSNSLIRVVDELPDVLFYKLNNGQKMRIVPLPDIDDDPKDEGASAFRNAVSNARITDDVYLAELEAVDTDADDYLDQMRTIERALKDRVRDELGMEIRPNRTQINLIQHARNNGITPSYDLPLPSVRHQDGRHSDSDIQTLLLPKDLERKLDAINSKCRTWIQETGINVLHIGYGFLEWSEPNQPKTAFAPLLLAGVEIEKVRTQNGSQYWLTGVDEEPEINAVLHEKLKLEFGVQMPEWDGASVENYFAEIASLAPKGLVWKVRRQVVVGVFPSAKMAMYYDLDPINPLVSTSPLVSDLLGGTDNGAASPFAEEYNVDEPDIEKHVPLVVLEADSSQFSTLVDIGRGQNVAVEGPPGTGKSQTIVNAIAVALASNKKVLFVAEKLAALNVVKSRLEACGLGEYLLPLQADRSTREQVIASVRERVEMELPHPNRDFAARIAEYRQIRSDLAGYIDVLTSVEPGTDMTVHEILGKGIATSPALDDIPISVLSDCSVSPTFLNRLGFGRLRTIAQGVEDAHNDRINSSTIWRDTKLTDPDRFTVEDACESARQASIAFREFADARSSLPDFGLGKGTKIAELVILTKLLRSHSALPQDARGAAFALLDTATFQHVSHFINACASFVEEDKALRALLSRNADEDVLSTVDEVTTIAIEAALDTIDIAKLEADLQFARNALASARAGCELIRPLVRQNPEAGKWRFKDIASAHQIVQAAGRLALSLRTPQMGEPSSLAILTELCATGRALQSRKKELGKRATIPSDISADVLAGDAAVIRSAGVFSFLSSNYRSAIGRARTLSLAENPTKATTVALLDAVASFRRDEQTFSMSPQTTAVFGLHFRGIDTDFGPFEAVAAYFTSVNSTLGTPDCRSLRNFLRSADLDELELLPAIPSLPPVEIFDELEGDIKTAEAEIGILSDAIGKLKRLVDVFVSPANIAPKSLSTLAARIREFLAQSSNLAANDVVRSICNDNFQGAQTDTAHLKIACEWAKEAMPESESVRAISQSGRLEGAIAKLESIVEMAERCRALLNRTCEVSKTPSEAFTSGRDAVAISEVLRAAANDSDGLFKHAKFATAMVSIDGAGVDAVVSHLVQAGETLEHFADKLEAIAARSLGRRMYAIHGSALAKYTGRTLNELRSALAKKDRQIIEMSREQLRHHLHRNSRPPRGNGVGKRSTWTQMALIENEIAKQQRFVPVRDLTDRAGVALLELKPCWMMSPLAVAQYIKKGAVQFDLCLIDEASQMPPEAALGALLRSKQVVVVGDTNQLPPSNFFKKTFDDTGVDEDETVIDESVLEMAKGTYRPSRRLRWHYRSRHSGLIKFSNRMIYQDNLVVFPSATESLSRMGVEFRAVNGFYKSGTNPVEARAMVEAVLDFMRTDSGRSLGIVTLNQAQQALISEEFEYALSTDNHAATYVEKWKAHRDGLEYFFIKNLENVQGDERDVIFIGTVYGPETQGGRVMQRFGPINGLAGKRRLNVLFSRAKEKIVTFSSMNASDIIAEDGGNQGAYMLKRWLEYSATGVLEAGVPQEREPDSDFEIFVIDQIRALGCEPVPQVGVAGYFVDIGVRHPNWPHGFILGVECDGASYHSAKSARDRDRLRQEVLEGLGWKLHRIWSTDWFNDSRSEAERLRAVISDRMAELKRKEGDYVQKPIKSDAGHRSEIVVERSSIVLPTKPIVASKGHKGVDVGDTVRIRYLSDDQKIIQVTISSGVSNTADGVVNHEAPIAQALLGAEEGEQVEILVGSYVKPAVVERIIKA